MSAEPQGRRSPGRRAALGGAGLAVAAIAVFGALAPPERCPGVSADELRASATDAVDWFTRNQRADGTWLYQYDADTDTEPDAYNVVRHAGAVMGLYQAAAAGIPGALESADRGLVWAEQRLLDRDDWSALSDEGRTTVGASALLVAGLVERRIDTADERHDELVRRLGRFLVTQTEPSGAVLARFDATTGTPVPGEYSKYYTGEAYWALARLHRMFPPEGWGAVADRVGAYLATQRDETEGYWPPLADHWVAYGLAETAAFDERDPRRPLTDAELEYARRQAWLFGSQVRWVSQQAGPWGPLVRGSHVPRGGGYGVVGEGLTGLWLVARADPRLDDVREPIAARAQCIAGLALRVQRGEDEALGTARPGQVEGAWFIDGVTRMDDQQHALSALLRTITIVEADAAGTASGADAAASAWLWLLALVAAFNPVRVALGVPRRGTRYRPAAALGGLGGGIGSLVAVAAALVAPPLVDALGVSDPALRIAVGVVAAVAGVAQLVGRSPSPDPALPGWQAGIVPVAIPLVAGPGLVLLAIGAGADRGAAIVAAACAIGTAVLGGLAAVTPAGGPGRRVASWAARLLAAVAVLASVLLVLDGVVDV